MPSSTFPTFQLTIPPDDGTNGPSTPVASATVKTHDATNDVPLSDTFTSDSDGVVASGTLPVAAGTLIRFRCENDGHGRVAYGEAITS